MANFNRTTKDGVVDLYYEVHGLQDTKAPTILLIAPGGMRSAVSFWQQTPWNPITALQNDYRVIAMDQRNAGASRGPVAADHGWHTYTEDQVALLDHLDVGQCHVGGMCIGGPYCFGLIQAMGSRVQSAVLWQTIGLDHNRDAFYDMFDSWAVDLQQSSHANVPSAAWQEFRGRMFDESFCLMSMRRSWRSARHLCWCFVATICTTRRLAQSELQSWPPMLCSLSSGRRMILYLLHKRRWQNLLLATTNGW